MNTFVVRRFSSSAAALAGTAAGKPRLVLLGTGWGAFAVLKSVNHEKVGSHILRADVPQRCIGPVFGDFQYRRRPRAHSSYMPSLQFDVTVVSPRNHMLFTPLLASTSVGTLEFRSIAEPLKYRFVAVFRLIASSGCIHASCS